MCGGCLFQLGTGGHGRARHGGSEESLGKAALVTNKSEKWRPWRQGQGLPRPIAPRLWASWGPLEFRTHTPVGAEEGEI